MKRFFLLCAVVFSAFAVQAHAVSAASLSLLLNRDTAGIGDVVTASLVLDSEGTSVNAAQATVTFPKELVQGESVDTSESVFNFWVSKPTFVNSAGRLSFIGGSTAGFSGRSLLLWRATFKVTGSGPISFQLTDAAVSAADGSGTNVLSSVRGAYIASLPKAQVLATPPQAVTPAATTTSVTPPPPVQIKRTPVTTSTAPVMPSLSVPLYPLPANWYNVTSNFLVKWNLPLDVSNVATVFDQIPGTDPNRSEGLFDNKIFPAPKNGVWYVHVRFKNNVGWGKTASYRVAVDTVPPATFDVQSVQGSATDDPTPTITYKSGDQLSGIAKYRIQVDSNEPVETKQEKYVLPIQLPGKHAVKVTAYDQAGNSTDEVLNISIVPQPSPTFAEISPDFFIGEGGLVVRGSGVASTTVVLILKTQAGQIVETRDIPVDAERNWNTTFDHPLAKGVYLLEAFTRDARGATSYVVQSHTIQARPRPFIVFMGIELSETVFFVVVIVLLLLGFGAGWFTRSRQKQRRAWRAVVSERDIVAVMESVLDDVGSALSKYRDDLLGKREALETKRLLNNIQKTVKKAEGYLVKNIEDLNK